VESDGVESANDSVFSQSSSTHSLYVYECIDLDLSANSEQEKSMENAEKFSTETFERKDETYSVKLFKGIYIT
jgi:hypothetical protein